MRGMSGKTKPVHGRLTIHSADGSVTLRQYTLDDAKDAFRLIERNREHLSQFGDDTARKYPTLGSFEESIRHPKNPNRLRFGVWNDKNVLVGTINLTPDSDNPCRGEMGYYLGEEFLRQGYMQRAVNALAAYAFDKLEYAALYGKVTKGNVASAKILVRLGFCKIGEVGDQEIYEKTSEEKRR